MRAGDYNLGLVDNDGGIRADFRSVHSGNGCVDAIGNLLDFEIGRGDAFWTCLVFGLRFEEACDGLSIHSLLANVRRSVGLFVPAASRSKENPARPERRTVFSQAIPPGALPMAQKAGLSISIGRRDSEGKRLLI